MNIHIPKHILFWLLGGTVAVSIAIIVFLVYQKAAVNPQEYVTHQKNVWVDLLRDNSEVLPYLEQLYTVEDELKINYTNGKLTTDELIPDTLNSDDLKKIEEFFKKFQWETIRLYKQTDTEQKVLEISSQVVFGNFFHENYGLIYLTYSPNSELDTGEEIFPGWYYTVYFNT